MSSGLQTRAQHEALWLKVKDRQRQMERERLKPPRIRLWDGDYVLRGEVAGERSGDFEFIENETGTAQLVLSLDHYLAKWVMNFKGRAKRNVHVTFDKQGARWAGRMDHYRVVKTKEGDRYLEINFKHDMEELKHIYCWVYPPLLAGRGVGLAATLSKSVPQARTTVPQALDRIRSSEVVLASDPICQYITA